MKQVLLHGRSVKTAVSLPAETYAMAEQIRRKTGASRSALYAEALHAYAKAIEIREAEAKYVAAYRAHPEDPAEVEAMATAIAKTMKSEKW